MYYMDSDELELLTGRDIQVCFIEFGEHEEGEDDWEPIEIERYAIGTLVCNDEDLAVISIIVKETDAQFLTVGAHEIIDWWLICDIEAMPLSPDDFYDAITKK